MGTSNKVARIDRKAAHRDDTARIETSIRQGMAHLNVRNIRDSATPTESAAAPRIHAGWFLCAAGVLVLLLVLWVAVI
jgi:hypothetical protein